MYLLAAALNPGSTILSHLLDDPLFNIPGLHGAILCVVPLPRTSFTAKDKDVTSPFLNSACDLVRMHVFCTCSNSSILQD